MQRSDISTIGLTDLMNPDVLDNPCPLYQRLRREDPVHQDPTLARMEAQVAFSELARSYPRIAIGGVPQRTPSSAFRGLLSLPVALNG
jgi:hypothetical protein